MMDRLSHAVAVVGAAVSLGAVGWSDLAVAAALEERLELIADLPEQEQAEWRAYFERSEQQSQRYRQYMEAELAAYGLAEVTAARGGSSFFRESLDKPLEWYASDEGRRQADIIVSFQTPAGGWSKGLDLHTRPRIPGELHTNTDSWRWLGTYDNGATHSHMRFVARTYQATGEQYYKDSFIRGLDYMLESQLPNGGFPQVYPLSGWYNDHITYNDHAMTQVMVMLHDLLQQEQMYDFIDSTRRDRLANALDRAVQAVLDTQIVVDGKRTAWCAQHHYFTLEPAKARSYELPSISGAESVGVVRFLMSLDDPSNEVIHAIQSAVAWFDEARLDNTAMVQVSREDRERYPRGYDRIVVTGPEHGPSWGRFNEIGTNRPMFVGRDGEVKYALEEIEYERRIGYRYLGNWPQRLLEREYPEWQAKWAPDDNVLERR